MFLKIFLPLVTLFASTALGSGGFPEELQGAWHFSELRCADSGTSLRVSEAARADRYSFSLDGHMRRKMNPSPNCELVFDGLYQVGRDPLKGNQIRTAGRKVECRSTDGSLQSIAPSLFQYRVEDDRLHISYGIESLNDACESGVVESVYDRDFVS